jgi:hypothetical protein
MGFRVLQERHGVVMVWTFAGTGRFKWKHDAHGGVVKALMRRYLNRWKGDLSVLRRDDIHLKGIIVHQSCMLEHSFENKKPKQREKPEK